MYDDNGLLQAVPDLVDEEHDLRSRMESGSITAEDESRRLREVEESLDQCWDLLRQRRARREAGLDPGTASVRDSQQVEGYLQ
ncbi:MAG: DUF2630 family protein [Actinomycetales bacterium]|nr:DUF2630 family protein [Actinomycetales bacterium]